MSAYPHLLHLVVLDKNPAHVERAKSSPTFLPRLFSRVFICWHRKMSRPFTRDGETYRVCLRCGVHRQFDLKEWKTKGSYYNPSVR